MRSFDLLKIPASRKVGHRIQGVVKVLRKKNDPSQASQPKSTHQHDRLSDYRLLLQTNGVKEPGAPILSEPSNHEVRAIQESPAHISPIRTVPQTTDSKRN